MEGTYSEEMGTIYHSSHLHVLQLIPSDQAHPQTRCCDPTATTMMNAKKRSNPVYGCRPCNFYIHKNCAELLPYIRHPSHPCHTLTLVHASPYLQGNCECDACCKPIDGRTGFSYHCTQCSFDLHTHCAFLPPTINNPNSGHPHDLSMRYPDAFSFTTYKCDLCRKTISAKAWLYHCVPCDFQAHTDCVLARRGGPPLGSAAPRPMVGQPTAAGQPPTPLMSGFTPAMWPGQVGSPWPVDGQPTAAGQQPNLLTGLTPAIWPGQVGLSCASSGLDLSGNHVAAPAQGTHTGYGFEEWNRVLDGQTVAPGQPPNPLISGLTPAVWPGQVGAGGESSGLDGNHDQAASPAEGAHGFEVPKKADSSPQNHGDGVTVQASDVGNSSQADVPEKTSNEQQQSGEVPDYVALQLEMMKLQMSMNFAQTTNNIISNLGRPRYYWY